MFLRRHRQPAGDKPRNTGGLSTRCRLRRDRGSRWSPVRAISTAAEVHGRPWLAGSGNDACPPHNWKWTCPGCGLSGSASSDASTWDWRYGGDRDGTRCSKDSCRPGSRTLAGIKSPVCSSWVGYRRVHAVLPARGCGVHCGPCNASDAVKPCRSLVRPCGPKCCRDRSRRLSPTGSTT
jgi:hypothetical protein